MRAMILAGGMSTRLYPLTKSVPKPLVPIAGEPNTAHTLRYLRSHGITEVAINVHYLAEQIHERLGDGSAYGVELTYLHEAKLMGSAGAVSQMRNFFSSDKPFVVIGCDSVTDIDLGSVIAFHRERRALASIALVHADDVTQYGVVVLDSSGKISRFQEKPKRGDELSHLVNTGIYVFEPGIFSHIPSGEFCDFGKNVFPSLQASGAKFYGIEASGAYWADIGTLPEYRRATVDVLTGKASVIDAIHARGVAETAYVAPSATLVGDVHVGAGARVGANAKIVGPSVIGDDVVIGDGARVERSIIWDRSNVGARSSVIDSIVGTDFDVEIETELRNAVVANESELALR